MVTLKFGTFWMTTVQNGWAPVHKARLDVVNPMAEKKKAKSLVLMTIKSEEIMWVYLDIDKDEQWEFSKPKLRGKCNTISLAMDDDTLTVTSLSDSKEAKFALVA